MAEKQNVVICGGGEREAWLHARAYRENELAKVSGVWCEDASARLSRAGAWDCRQYESFESVLSDPAVVTVELLDPMDERAGRARAALDAKKHVLIGAPFATDSGQGAQIADAASRSGCMLMSYENRMFYPPAVKVKSLIEKRAVGRVSAIRMRTLIAGAGGWDADLNPDFSSVEPETATGFEETLFREIFEKISLAHKLLGPIEEIYSPNIIRDKAAVLTWKHRAPASYGVLDITFAPGMNIRSAYDSRDDNIEISGSSGIIWQTHGCSQVRHEPSVKVYRVDKLFSFCELENDWQYGYDNCARHFSECVAGKARPALDPGDSAAAVEYTQAAIKSAESARRVRIRG